jgi:L-galactose dehydrogenase
MQQRPFGSTGDLVSAIGFGAGPIGGAYGDLDDTTALRAVQRALDVGITLFDTSPYYGVTRSEERLGRALLGHRDEVFLVTKCGRYDLASFDFSAKRVAASVQESLARLRTDRLDLLLAHDVEFDDLARIENETIPALLREREQGRARFVGVSGYPIPVLQHFVEHTPIDAVLTYCHHDLLSDDAAPLVAAAARRGIAVVNASTLHMGILTNGGPPAWHPAPEPVKAAGRAATELCRARGRDVAEVALQHALALPGIACTLVGCKTAAEVDAAVAASRAPRDRALERDLAALLAPVHNVCWPSGHWRPN